MTDELRFERVIDAPLDVVFEAFTTDRGQDAFYGQDDPGWIVESDCDLRVGGVWTVTFGPARSHLYRQRHVFEVIDRPRRLVLATTELRADGSSALAAGVLDELEIHQIPVLLGQGRALFDHLGPDHIELELPAKPERR